MDEMIDTNFGQKPFSYNIIKEMEVVLLNSGKGTPLGNREDDNRLDSEHGTAPGEGYLDEQGHIHMVSPRRLR